MDQSTYTGLTGRSIPSGFNFDDVLGLAQSRLEGMLGYPLDPGDWDNQYIEIGKARDECACPDVELSDLDDPDPVIDSYRLFRWRPSDRYLSIDPAYGINSVKLVKDGVTYKTFDSEEYGVQWINGEPAFTKYLAHVRWNNLICGCGCGHWENNHVYQLAVDAEWAFEEIPLELQLVLASMLSSSFDFKDNIKSETITSHSYTKFDAQPIEKQFAYILTKYQGPNAKRTLV